MARKHYDDEFKRGAVKLVRHEGYTIKKAATALGVDGGSVRRWIREFPDAAGERAADAPADELRRENARLREENRRLLLEREILKKAATFFAKELT
jgi:transposase